MSKYPYEYTEMNKHIFRIKTIFKTTILDTKFWIFGYKLYFLYYSNEHWETKAYLELHNAKSLCISFEIKPIVIYPWCSPVVELSQPKTRCYIELVV